MLWLCGGVGKPESSCDRSIRGKAHLAIITNIFTYFKKYILRLKQILLWLCEGVGRPESSCDRSISAAACLCTTLTSFALLQYQLVRVGDTLSFFRNIDVDVDSEEDGGDDHEDVVAHELLGDGVVEGGGPGRGGVELGEGVDQQLRGRQEQVDGDQTEQFA